jgi:hypothetical protein
LRVYVQQFLFGCNTKSGLITPLIILSAKADLVCVAAILIAVVKKGLKRRIYCNTDYCLGRTTIRPYPGSLFGRATAGRVLPTYLRLAQYCNEVLYAFD